MPTPSQIADNRFMTLDRLLLGDRVVWQHRDGECWPEAVWWEQSPQIGRPKLWLSTCKWLRERGLIIEGLRPKDSNYLGYTTVTLYVATPKAEEEFVDFGVSSFEKTKKAASS